MDYETRPIHIPRRRDHTVEDESWIEALLARAPFGTLATEYKGQPFVHTSLFAYDPKLRAIFIHTAREGRTRFNVEINRRVSFGVSEMGRLLPADSASEFNVEYAGVIVFGTAQVIRDYDEAEYGLQLMLDKYFPHLQPGEDYRRILPEETNRTSVFRIDIESWSGKKEAAPEDFPGAFTYPYADDKA